MNKTFCGEFAKIEEELPRCKFSSQFRDIKAHHEDRPIVLYSASRLASSVLDLCIGQGIDVARVCDRSVTGSYCGIPIINPQTLRNGFADAVVIVCSRAYNKEICEDLNTWGFSSKQVIPCPFESAYFESQNRFRRHFEGYAWAHDFFQDEISKQLVIDRLRLCLLDLPLSVNTSCDCYYEDGFISLSENEIFVDAGAYVGDSAEAFIRKTSSRGYHVYAFEPDKRNFEQAVHNLSKYSNVHVVQKGLWSMETELVFSQNTSNMAGSSFVIGTSENRYAVPVTSLDCFFKNKEDNEIPTFIKMDIEGAEKEALLGAAEIIRRRKPKLAICAYHKPEDIYELPRTILSIRDDYKFALRQHEFGCWDTVLYAV
jgi:FkbM family methyltransferase